MRRICIGIMAHVDAGKTTLSEGLLYCAGSLRRLGRVDHKDAFLDTGEQERQRGITIFAKQALLTAGQTEITLVDTPGHVDFSSETERTLAVLDCAVLLISGTDGVQSHTLTLWRLLERRGIPTFLFVNKMDLATADREKLLSQLRERLSENCVDFTAPEETLFEQAAMCGEEALEQYLATGRVEEGELRALTAGRRLFPCYFGSALRLEGVEELLDGLDRYSPNRSYPDTFSARVYKIARDPRGERLTFLKVTGGALKVRDTVKSRSGEGWEEKVNQIRLYSGERYQTADRVEAGTVCAVTGLRQTYPGEGLGEEREELPPLLEPVFSYRLVLPQGCDSAAAVQKLRELGEEDPQLHLVWNEQLREIRLALMGAVQLEVLRELIRERYGLEVDFDAQGAVYKETIAQAVEGVGHFEPLRHYAEVHLLLEPLARGSGLELAADCPQEMLSAPWQRLILTHLAEKEHLGVLTGSPITDMRITLVAGRGHEKHTEGGDFRQATYRAVRQGLMEAQTVLLEPWYDFTLEVPAESVGRAMTDLQRMGGRVEQPETVGETVCLRGTAPAAALGSYGPQVTVYTRGRGRLSCALRGYEPCADQEKVVSAIGYDPERDTENTPDSVFCEHGAGVVVKWDKVKERMHVVSPLARPRREEEPQERLRRGSGAYTGTLEQDKELQAIFERTYGKVSPRAFEPPPKPRRTSLDEGKYALKERETGPEYLLVDGYNIIFAWEELEEAARHSLDAARQQLMDILSNYQGFRKCEVILVFDAYKVPRGRETVERYHNIHVVYTKEAETADAYIEKVTYQLARQYRVRVATSDGAEQLIILGHGALRLSATAFRAEVEAAAGQIAAILSRNNRPEKSRSVERAWREAESRNAGRQGE